MADLEKQDALRFSDLLEHIALDPNLNLTEIIRLRLQFIQSRLDRITLGSGTFYQLHRIETLYKQYNAHPEDNEGKKELIRRILFLYQRIRNNGMSDSEYNTEDYYKKTISELETKVKELSISLKESKESKEQKEEIKKELEERREQIRQITADKEELEKKLDAQENIKKKITDAVEGLKKHTSQLEKEKARLNGMFGVYAFLCVCVLGILVYFEFVYLSKWQAPTKLIDYLPFYIPVPIVGGLLWAFIYQMNRAQRQLMLVSYELYHVDYIEGLLQAINMVSPNVASATEKIGNVLDVLIKKHITSPNELFEKSLDKEISKDNIDLKTFVNLAKDVKGVIK